MSAASPRILGRHVRLLCPRTWPRRDFGRLERAGGNAEQACRDAISTRGMWSAEMKKYLVYRRPWWDIGAWFPYDKFSDVPDNRLHDALAKWAEGVILERHDSIAEWRDAELPNSKALRDSSTLCAFLVTRLPNLYRALLGSDATMIWDSARYLIDMSSRHEADAVVRRLAHEYAQFRCGERTFACFHIPYSFLPGVEQPLTWTASFGVLGRGDLSENELLDAAEQLKQGNDPDAERVLALVREAGSLTAVEQPMLPGATPEPLRYGGLTEEQHAIALILERAKPGRRTQKELSQKLHRSKSKVEKDLRVLREWRRPGRLATDGTQSGYAATEHTTVFLEEFPPPHADPLIE